MIIVLCDGCGDRIQRTIFKALDDPRVACSARCLSKLGISVPAADPCEVWFMRTSGGVSGGLTRIGDIAGCVPVPSGAKVEVTSGQ